MKSFIANTIVKWFKRLGFAGRFRFKCLYWAYRITGWHIRHREWDFVLDYLPPLGKWQNVRVLDVGAAKSLFIHEVKARGYNVYGLDLNPYQEKFCKFFVGDIRELNLTNDFDFITCISVLEHIADGNWEEQKIALSKMIEALKIGGRLLLTIPTNEYAQGHPWHGFRGCNFKKMLLPDNVLICEYTERVGQLCLAIERID